MRFDKMIWETTSAFYDQIANRSTLDVSHFNEATKAWVSIWLDLVNNDRAVFTKRADGTSVPALLEEVLARIFDVDRGFDIKGYRLKATLSIVLSMLKRDPILRSAKYPAVSDFETHAENTATFLETEQNPNDNALHKTASQVIHKYGCKDIRSATIQATQQLGLSAKRLLRHLNFSDQYLEDCVNRLQALLTSPTLTPDDRAHIYYLSASIASQFFVKGHSPTSLAELHLTALRADHSGLKGRPLADRLRNMFAETIAPQSGYMVYFRVTPKVVTDELLPPYIRIVQPASIKSEAVSTKDGIFKKSLSTAGGSILGVNCTEAIPNGNRIPDRFTAAHVARGELGNVLDVLLMIHPRRVSIDDWCLVVDHFQSPRAFDVQLYRERDYAQDEIRVKYLHEAQEDLQRALHWYRKAVQSHSDESGLLEAWISLEYLAQGLKDDAHKGEIVAIQRYFPRVLALRMLSREFDYVLSCIRTYVTFSGTQLPKDYQMLASPRETDGLAALLRLAGAQPADRDAVFATFNRYPHVAWELQRLCQLAASGAALQLHLMGLTEQFTALFYRAYALRNDIVHNARVTMSEIPLLRRYFADALRELYHELLTVFRLDPTLTVPAFMRETFQEYEQLKAMFGTGATVDSLMYAKHHFNSFR